MQHTRTPIGVTLKDGRTPSPHIAVDDVLNQTSNRSTAGCIVIIAQNDRNVRFINLVKTNNNTKLAFLDGWTLTMAATNGPAFIHICLSLTVSSFAPITQFIMIYLGNTSTFRIFRNFVLFCTHRRSRYTHPYFAVIVEYY